MSAPLPWAADRGQDNMVRYLLSRRADVDDVISPWSMGEAAGSDLHKMVGRAHVDVIDTLLSAGADVRLKDTKSRTAMEIAKEKGMDVGILEKLS